MKEIYFGKMSYFDNDNSDENIIIDAQDSNDYNEYKFNKTHFNKLLEEQRFIEAADYASKYHFSDTEKDNVWGNKIEMLRNKGRIAEACYSRVSEADKAAVQFSHQVLDGNIYTLNNNDYVNKFDEYKRQLGGNNAETLEIRFAGKKRTGLFGWDWLAKDREREQIEDFYNASGLNYNDLLKNGVRVKRNEDGSTSLIFSKNNALSNKILYYTPELSGDYDIKENPYIKGYDKDGNDVSQNQGGKSEVLFNPSNTINLSMLKKVVDDARKIEANYFTPSNEVIQYSSKIGPAINPALEALNASYENGDMKYTEYYKHRSELLGGIEEQIMGSAPEYLDMRTNAFNDSETDKHLALTDQQQRIALHAYLSSIDRKHIHYYSQTSNGKFGTRVVIDAHPYGTKDGGDANKAPKEFQDFAKKEIAIFFPGVGSSIAEQLMMQDTSLRASIELDNMQQYKYDYKTSDGKNISFGGPTGFTIDKQPADYQKVVDTINKDMAISDFVRTVPYKYVNRWGTELNKDGNKLKSNADAFDLESKKYAIALAQELHPNVPFTDENGNIITDIDEIFKIALTNKYKTYYDAFHYNVFNLYAELNDIWNRIYNETRYYSFDRLKD